MGTLFAGCAPQAERMPADQAFALSASALSGKDKYGYAGEVSVIGPNGWLTEKTTYRGEIAGHGPYRAQWSRTGGLSAQAVPKADIARSLHPLFLLDAIAQRSSAIAYGVDETPSSGGDVFFRLKLDDITARSRIADGLRDEMTALRMQASAMRLAARSQSEAVLSRADRKLAAALDTLQVSTQCRWTASRRTWFPRELREETTLRYVWEGKPHEEKRISVTRFLFGKESGTIKP
jgi:hypothetical protein